MKHWKLEIPSLTISLKPIMMKAQKPVYSVFWSENSDKANQRSSIRDLIVRESKEFVSSAQGEIYVQKHSKLEIM